MAGLEILSCSPAVNYVRNSLLSQNNRKFKPLHLSTIYNSLGRWKRKTLAGDNWFKEQGKTNGVQQTQKAGRRGFKKAGSLKIEPSTVMFIPSTKGGLLTRKMKENDVGMTKLTKFRVKIQEA